jgi:hypothetical protein
MAAKVTELCESYESYKSYKSYSSTTPSAMRRFISSASFMSPRGLFGVRTYKIELKEFWGTQLVFLTKGPWYFIHTLYVLVCLVLCTIFYYQHYMKGHICN